MEQMDVLKINGDDDDDDDDPEIRDEGSDQP